MELREFEPKRVEVQLCQDPKTRFRFGSRTHQVVPGDPVCHLTATWRCQNCARCATVDALLLTTLLIACSDHC